MSLPFSALLLAGGKSRRMGRDKAFLEIDREVLWQRQVRILRELSPNELFIAGTLHDENCITIGDAEPDSGPLAGIVAALRRTSTSLLLVLAVDLARMTSTYLRAPLASASSDCGIVPRGQPLAAIYPSSALRIAERHLGARELSMHKLVDACIAERLVRSIEIAANDELLFQNLNTPADVRAITHAAE